METSSGIALNWLLRLRWWVIACQILLVLAIVLLFQVVMPYPVLGLIIGFAIVSNLYFYYRLRHRGEVGEEILLVVMFLDILLFTGLLYATGGPMNPFTFIYLVHISLGAILLRPRWSLILAGVASLAYASLFFLPLYIPSRDLGLVSLTTVFAPCHIETEPIIVFGREISPHLQGMWVAFAISAFFIVFFVGQAYKALARHRQVLHELREGRRKAEKLASLATLAAGAAHELATPLATIAVAAGEMRHQLKNLLPATAVAAQPFPAPGSLPATGPDGGSPPEAAPAKATAGTAPSAPTDPAELLEDLELIRDQVERCREILYQMGADAGEHHGEEAERFPLKQAVAQALNTFTPDQRQRIRVNNGVEQLTVRMPLRTISRVLRGLIKNGLEASELSATPVQLSCRAEKDFLIFTVRDQGPGMDPAVRERAGEPFFTTKEVGRGMGLGLFLAKSAAEHFGGTLELDSAPGRGCTVTLRLALNKIR